MAKPTEQKIQLTLGMRFVLATVLVVVLAVGTAVVVTTLIGKVIADNAVDRMLERSSAVERTFQEKSLDHLRLVARLFANDPPFAAYVADSIVNEDPFSAHDQLTERQGDLGFDLAIILMPDGRVFTRTDNPEPERDDLSEEPMVIEALNEFEAYGTWVSGGELYYAAAVPIGVGGLLQGFLIAGAAIDSDAALELRQISDSEITFLLHGDEGLSLAATTLDSRRSNDLEALLRDRPELLESGDEPVEITLDRRRYLALTTPLAGVSDERLGSVLSLASLEDQLEPYARLTRTLLIVGALAIAVAIGLSLLMKRGISQPIEGLMGAAQRAAAGDYDQKIPKGAGEVGQLAEAFDTLLSDLREKRDMEVYISELARSVPEDEGSPALAEPEMVPAEAREMILVGIELRGYTEQLSQAATPRDALDRLAQVIRFLVQGVSSRGGTVQAVAGHRIVASFQGNRRGEHALAAAGAVLTGTQDLRLTNTTALFGNAAPASIKVSAAVALVTGQMVSGSVIWSVRTEKALVGPALEELENLLRVASPGSLWLSRTAADTLGDHLRQDGVEPQEHKSSLSREPIYAIPREAMGRFDETDFTATQDLTSTPGSTATATLSALGPGSQLGERFKILSELGAGGMGVVYKARDFSLNELVALKMLKADVWNDAERLASLKEELKLARKIAHPNVLRTYDFGELQGVPFISMEYVRGITLRRLLDQSGRLPLSAGLRLARQLCKGLQAAHDEGVVHRDIKPENLIVEHTGNVKLMDFGIAQKIQRKATQTSGAAIVGTPFYLAPEQLQGQEADERADIYASGVVIYELFTGRLPYPLGANVMELITTKLKEPPAPPSQHWATIPLDLENLILRCLQKRPEDRYENVNALLRELEVLRA